MDKVPKLGQLITEPQGRDAVHIAVAPVVAGMRLYPGEHIGFVGNAYTVGTDADHIGIVDPFLPNTVEQGEQFYMFLYPNTITSLRHEWIHPAFTAEDAVAEYQPTFDKLKGFPEEEKWISEYADNIGVSFDEIMEAASNYLKYGEYFCRGGDFEGHTITEEFWEKYEVITREKVTDRGTFLTCSC